MEVFNMLPEGTRCEVIDNTIYMSPSPTSTHQDILGDIYLYLKLFVLQHDLGKVHIAPLDVYLNDEGDVVQPDLLFVKKGHLHKIALKGVIGAPDLVLEVLSSNSDHDTKVKFHLYERSLVPEYAVVNPETKEVCHYKLIADQYEQLPSTIGILHIESIGATINF